VAPLPSYPLNLEQNTNPRYQALVFGYQLTDVRLTGGGSIDGQVTYLSRLTQGIPLHLLNDDQSQGSLWWDAVKKGELNHSRPCLIEMYEVVNLEIDHLRLYNSPFYTVHPYSCDTVHVHDLHIENPVDSPNTDGIDPDSTTNVIISNCSISTGYSESYDYPQTITSNMELNLS